MHQEFLGFRSEIVADLFAGGGGASEGIKMALGRCPDIAVNHHAPAIWMHETNHPSTTHYISDVFAVDPHVATKGQPVGLAWFSPDCKHFSKAKGGKPVSKHIRGLAWDMVRWGRTVKPRVMILENVEEFITWGPVDKVTGMPIKDKAGWTFKRWQGCLEAAGYVVERRELRACDYGAPTIRKRLFVIARRDGLPIVWPKPTHGKGRGLKPFRTAAECIDFTRPCHSIFLTKEEGKKLGIRRPLAPATLRRVATGTVRHVINNPNPFLVNTRNGERPGQEPRTRSVNEPYWTPTAAGSQGALVTPVVAPHVTKFRTGSVGHGVDEPLHTICSGGDMKRDAGAAHAMGLVEATVAPFLAQRNGDTSTVRAGRPIDEPFSTIMARGSHQQLVSPVIVGIDNQSNGQRDAWPVDEPLRTTTVENRFAVAVPFIAGVGGRAGQSRPRGVNEPYATTTTKADAALCAAFLAQHNTGMVGHDLRKPLSTSTAKVGPQAPVIVKLKGTAKHGQKVDDPLHTVQAGGTHFALAGAELVDGTLTDEELQKGHRVYAFLIKYYTSGSGKTGARVDKPMPTVRTKDGLGLVLVHVGGGNYGVIIDICMRMLTAKELFAAQGFPVDYQIAKMHNGQVLNATEQVRMCGNSVCPPVAEAIVRANFKHEHRYEAMAA